MKDSEELSSEFVDQSSWSWLYVLVLLLEKVVPRTARCCAFEPSQHEHSLTSYTSFLRRETAPAMIQFRSSAP
jgi:hypothetical protein